MGETFNEREIAVTGAALFRSAQANSLLASITNVRKAIDRYYAEHSRFPGHNASSGNTPDGDWFIDQLTRYSDKSGLVSDFPSQQFRFGPYLRRPFPTNPWIKRRIFPGGYTPSLRQMLGVFEPNGLSVLDVENLRLNRHIQSRGRFICDE